MLEWCHVSSKGFCYPAPSVPVPCSHHDVPCDPRPIRNKQVGRANINNSSSFANYSDNVPQLQKANKKVTKKGHKTHKPTNRKNKASETKMQTVREQAAVQKIRREERGGHGIDSALVILLKRNCCVNKANIYLRVETDGSVEQGLKLQSDETLRTQNDNNAPKAPLPVSRAWAPHTRNMAKRGPQIKTWQVDKTGEKNSILEQERVSGCPDIAV